VRCVAQQFRMEYAPSPARRGSPIRLPRGRPHRPASRTAGRRVGPSRRGRVDQLLSAGRLVSRKPGESADDGTDGAPVASDSTFDALAGGGVPLDDTDSVVVRYWRREAGLIPDEGTHPLRVREPVRRAGGPLARSHRIRRFADAASHLCEYTLATSKFRSFGAWSGPQPKVQPYK